MSDFKDKVLKLGNTLIDVFKQPFEDLKTNEGLTNKNLKALLQKRGVSDLLLYRDYQEIDKKGVYTMADGRKGIAFQIYPPTFLGEFAEKMIQSFLASIDIEGVIVHFNTFVSQNIEKEINEFIKYHHCDSNIKHPELLKSLIMQRAAKIREWSKKSIIKGGDLRVKNFINTITILFPKDTSIKRILSSYDSVKGALQDFSPHNLEAKELETVLREIFHSEKNPETWESTDDNLMAMNYKITSGGLKITTNEDYQGFKINDKIFAKTLTTKKFPKNISLYDFSNIFFNKLVNLEDHTIPGRFVVSLVIKYDNIEKIKEKTANKAKADLKELYKLGNIDVKSRPDLSERKKEVQDTLQYLENGEIPVKAMWNITLFEETESKITEVVSRLIQQFSLKQWDLIEESDNNIALMSFLFGLPLQHHTEVEEFLKRFNILFRSNNASICPIIGDSKGSQIKHMPQITRTGQLAWYNPFESKTNYNVVAMGTSGSGKSFSYSEQIVMGLAAGHILRVIDSGKSYKKLCDIVGGQSIQFEEGDGSCLNFFTKVPTQTKFINGEEVKVIHEEMFPSIIPIIGIMIGVDLTNDYEKMSLDAQFIYSLLEKSINVAFNRRSFSTNLEDVRDVLIEQRAEYAEHQTISENIEKMITSLYPYADKEGAYYKYFNGVNNINFNSDFFLLELDNLEKKGNLYNLVLMFLANEMFVEFYNDKTGRKKVLIVDEAWKVFGNEIIVSFLEGVFRRIRKYGGSAVTITQSIKDYYMNKTTIALYENSSFKFFLQQDEDKIDEALSTNKLSLNKLEEVLLKSVKKRTYFAENYIKYEGNNIVGRLFVDSYAYYLYSTNADDKNLISYIEKTYKLDLNSAIHICAIMRDDEVSEEEAIKKFKDSNLNKEHSKEREQIYKNLIEIAIKDINNIDLYSQAIFSKEGGALKEEIFFRLKDITQVYSPLEIIQYAKKANLYTDLSFAVVKRIFSFIASNKGQYSFNLSIEDIMSYNIVDFLITQKEKMNLEANRVAIEIPLKDLSQNNEFLVMEAIKRLKESGFLISNDNIDTTLEFDVLFKTVELLDFLKIDSKIIKNIDLDNNLIFVKMLIMFAKQANIEIICVHIDSKDKFELFKELGVNLFQGYLFEEPKKIS